jgi:hypothetical protein
MVILSFLHPHHIPKNISFVYHRYPCPLQTQTHAQAPSSHTTIITSLLSLLHTITLLALSLFHLQLPLPHHLHQLLHLVCFFLILLHHHPFHSQSLLFTTFRASEYRAPKAANNSLSSSLLKHPSLPPRPLPLPSTHPLSDPSIHPLSHLISYHLSSSSILISSTCFIPL